MTDATPSHCIVCPTLQPAGSKEHVFPAAMGGRHENGKIYCGEHNEGYSPLVAPLAEQFSVFNMALAVVPDRAKAPKSVLVDVPDGPKGVKLSATTSELTQPMLIHQETLAEGTALSMGFATRAAGKDWIAKLESVGALASAPQKGRKTQYLLPLIPVALRLDRSTLAALAYIAQTHFAEQFPEVVRSAAFRPFIDFTWTAAQLERARERARGAVVKAGGDPWDTQQVDATPEVLAAQAALDASLTAFGGDWPINWWWPAGKTDASSADDPHCAPNACVFGHRVTVGIKAGAGVTERADGTEEGGGVAYARVSLFSTFHATIEFARGVNAGASREVSIDIDPLAAGHPSDRTTVARESAASRREVPAAQTDAEEIRQSLAVTENEIVALLERIQEHALTLTAQVEHARLIEAVAADPAKLAGAVSELVDRQLQRVWNMLTSGIEGLKAQQQQQGLRGTAGLFDQLIARDKTSPSGLSQGAEASLLIARHALEGQLIAEFGSGKLDVERLKALLGWGAGVSVVLGAVLAPVLAGLKR